MKTAEHREKKSSFTCAKWPVITVLCTVTVVPILLNVLHVPAAVPVIYAAAAGTVLSVVYVFAVSVPAAGIRRHIGKMTRGDMGDSCTVRSPVPDINGIAAALNSLTDETLNPLVSGLKMEILHSQDASNDFLTKVQETLTDSSRISLSVDYINCRIGELNDLIDQSIRENHAVGENLEAYEKLVGQQKDAIRHTGTVQDEIVSGLRQSMEMLAEKKNASSHLESVTNGCSEKVGAVSAAVKDISDGVGTLKDMMHIIASVAARTNLLAMNAAIEAAHAGQAGAGFSVVAEEIRTLAETTSKQISTISASLKHMTAAIENASVSSAEADKAFRDIRTEVASFVTAFDEVIGYYNTLAEKTETIRANFSIVRDTEKEISDGIDAISSSIGHTAEHLGGVIRSSREISSIVKQNAEEALRMSRSQEPIYINTVENGKNFERIRKQIDVFRLKGAPYSMWAADKSGLRAVIDALFDHLDWTVKILRFLHDESDIIKQDTQIRSSYFGEWLYTTAVRRYSRLPCFQDILNINGNLQEKLLLLIRLKDAGKELEATIEFSEMLENSRRLVLALNEIKKYEAQHLGESLPETDETAAVALFETAVPDADIYSVVSANGGGVAGAVPVSDDGLEEI